MSTSRQILLDLADRCEREEPSRELSDAVMFACGWRTNFSADEIDGVRRAGGSPCEDEGGQEYIQPYSEFMDNACWYAPGSKTLP